MPDKPQNFEIHSSVENPVDGWWKTLRFAISAGASGKCKLKK